jgi:micrococcal nuclease
LHSLGGLLGVAWVAFVAPTTLSAQGACSPEGPLQRVGLRYVSDGDTLVLSDGRRLRLIGINTPERGRDGKPD